jgi:DNA-binding NarL/FixJ family response regulator
VTLKGYAAVGPLTPRMRDVLLLASNGRTVRETATLLGVSEGTVRSVRGAALVRLEASSVIEGVSRAIREGQI